VFFSSERFQGAIQPFIQALPLTAIIEALRGNMLQGMTLSDMPLQLTVIAAWLGGCFVLALKLFRWR
jgi:ABC-type polysaccharide/polyol phosphate export permease